MAEKKQMTTQNMLVALLVVAALVIGYLYGQNKSLSAGGGAAAPTVNDPAAAPDLKPEDVDKVTSKDHVRGNLKTAKVAIIEYSDFECVYCASFHPTIKQASEDYGDDVVWVYRHFPLDQKGPDGQVLHPNARTYAEASECVYESAGDKGFWAFGDTLFERRDELADISLRDDSKVDTDDATVKANKIKLDKELSTIAVSLGANKAKYDACASSQKYAKKVVSQYETGVKAGVSGTPGNIVVNLKSGEAKLIAGAVDLATLKASIDAMMK